MGMGQNPIPLVNIKIAGKWMFIPLKMVLIGIDPYPYGWVKPGQNHHFGQWAILRPFSSSGEPLR